MEKASVSHMNTRLPLPNRTSTFLQFKHIIPFLKFPNPDRNPNPNLVRLRRPNCSISDGTVPSSVAATNSSLALKKKAAEVAPELKGTSVFLVGMKSSLKTSLGKLLADALRYYYFDSDSLVEEAVGGAQAAKSFRESDEKGFYESETEVLKQLSSMGRLVVCAGNGTVTSSTNLALLRHGISLWIDVPLDFVARDVIEDQSQFGSSEISISGSHPEVKDELGALYDKYRDGYATADAIISVQSTQPFLAVLFTVFDLLLSKGRWGWFTMFVSSPNIFYHFTVVASRLGCDNLGEITREDMTLEALWEIEKLTRVKKMMEEAARPF